MRIMAAAFLALLTGGCATLGGGASTVEVITTPPGALLTIDGVGSCETPCPVKLDGPRRARIAKAGYVSLTVTLSPGRRAVTIPLELAAPSEPVDTTALPDLN